MSPMVEETNYARIAKAIEYINDNFKQQPNLSEIAEHIHLSEAHFQRLFTEWAGVSPKKFLQYISIEHAKNDLDIYIFIMIKILNKIEIMNHLYIIYTLFTLVSKESRL